MPRPRRRRKPEKIHQDVFKTLTTLAKGDSLSLTAPDGRWYVARLRDDQDFPQCDWDRIRAWLNKHFDIDPASATEEIMLEHSAIIRREDIHGTPPVDAP